MTDTPRHHRRSIRLSGYNYTQEGAYFVTICTYNRLTLFGEIIGEEMRLSPIGEIVEGEWRQTAIVRRNIELDAFVIMPNHLHGILVISDNTTVGATRRVAPTDTDKRQLIADSLGAIIGQFKSVVTKRILKRSDIHLEHPLWQRNYYEHIIRNENELNRIRQYIASNPARWHEDSLYQGTSKP
jgi:REP element-mobilizing transposase RayT